MGALAPPAPRFPGPCLPMATFKVCKFCFVFCQLRIQTDLFKFNSITYLQIFYDSKNSIAPQYMFIG